MEALSLLEKPPRSAPKITRRPPSVTYDDSIYSGKYAFELDDTQGGLVQNWIKAVVSTGGVSGDINTPQGLNLLSQIKLAGETGPIQTIDRVTLLARIDLIFGSNLYKKLERDIGGIGDYGSGDVTYYIPLFWFFSDLPGGYLDLKNKGKLWIEITTLSSKEAMGMELEITSMKFELYSYYKQFRSYVPKPISNTYDRFPEETIRVFSGTTSVRVLLKCPSEVFYLHSYLLVDSTAGSDQITSVQLEGPNK
ncbi:hypothetical protein BASA81_015398 [Batrachochytrium salamandrivorans]|nr:hypothetical protein BASA81_015398 [Batrachochytrium salamandrivorans]